VVSGVIGSPALGNRQLAPKRFPLQPQSGPNALFAIHSKDNFADCLDVSGAKKFGERGTNSQCSQSRKYKRTHCRTNSQPNMALRHKRITSVQTGA
jgi:hypothetical protein